MPLISGSRLGPYEILSALGSGGMGEVYRARDTRLKRDVAIKVLPEAFAQDPDRLARFQREAELLATLNHPNIAAVYGLEHADPSPGSGQAAVTGIVLELVEGETLADLIARGPVAIIDALPIARQIADALEAAHEKGVIHRDLKPANIKVTPDGVVKVLDFGLAKLNAPNGPNASNDPNAFSTSPTLSVQATYAGVILGTAAYMSPEQARGRVVDKRTDVWAFGCVLYEMLTGTRPFGGEDLADTIGAVIHKEPAWAALPPATPATVRTVLQRCLEKDPKQRIRDIGDVQLALSGAFESPAPPAAAAEQPATVPRRRIVAATASAALLVGAAVAALATWALTRPAPPRLTRTTITTSGAAALTTNGTDRDLAVTQDGTHVVYVGNSGTQLFVRALDALEPLAIAKGLLRGPFVSPDGHWVGFFDGGTLKKVAITGGPPITLAPIDGLPRGATWASDDAIVFATSNNATGLLRVSAAGGTPEVLTRPDHPRGEADHLWPEIMPGDRAVLFTVAAQAGGLDAAQVAVRDLRTGTQKVLVRGGSHAHYVASGHLVYIAAGTLRAIPFDLTSLETHGTAVPVVPGLVTTSVGAGDFAAATDGTLVYVDAPAGLAGTARTLVWVDRAGKEEPLTVPPRGYLHPRLSPDGMRVAVSAADEEQDLWVWDLRRATLTRLTFDASQDSFPVWTPDGRRIVYYSDRAGQLNLWWQAADGTGAAERLTTSSNPQLPTAIAPDGTAVVFFEATRAMSRDLLLLSLDGSHRVTPLLQTKFEELNGIVSPDGRWLAYESNSSGRFETYVRPFPNAGSGQWQVSTGGGVMPLWARSGKELFYFAPDGALMRVGVEASGAIWNAGTPTKLLEGRYYTGGGTTSAGRTTCRLMASAS